MSIPYSFDPLGTLVSGWCPVDMAAFVASTWAEGELVPLGNPVGAITTRNCARSAADKIVYFGYAAHATTATARHHYGANTCPPRQSSRSAAPALELWRTGDAAPMRVTVRLDYAVVKACCTVDAWQTWTTLPVTDNGDGTYTIETPPCRAVSMHCGAGSYSINGTVTQIEIWK